MSTRRIAGGLIALVGLVLVIYAAIALIGGDDDPPVSETLTASTTTPVGDTTSTSMTTSTTATTTTPVEAAGTTSSPTPTEPPPEAPDPEAEIEWFAGLFAFATEAGDAEFLFDRLHPAVVLRDGEAACRAFVEGTILQIQDYRINGDPVETQRLIQAGDRSLTIEPAFEVPVALTLDGEPLEITAVYAPVQDEMTWLGECA